MDKSFEILAIALKAIIKVTLGGWYFMLTVGIVHHEWIPQLPTLGYGSSVLIFSMMSLILFYMQTGDGE